MTQRTIQAVFMRGGTSKALIFHRRDLPAVSGKEYRAWDDIFLAAMGSPDPNGRQLDGMGGGFSSLSKVAVIGPPTRDDADVDYTFGQVAIDRPVVGYRANCGNISSAVGPFAVDEGLVRAHGNRAEVRIHNTNTGKIIVATFPLENGRAAVRGDFSLKGVAGTGAPIRLAFTDPGGAATGQLLPTGNPVDEIEVRGLGRIEVSLVDAANPTVFVSPEVLGLTGLELPDELDRHVAMFEEVRVAAAVAMGLADEAEVRTTLRNLPLVSIVSPPRDAPMLSGAVQPGSEADITTRVISAGQPHRATPLTGAMCLAVAARIPGTVAQAAVRGESNPAGDLRIAHPSGMLPVAARVSLHEGAVRADEAVVYRTARRLMTGSVCT